MTSEIFLFGLDEKIEKIKNYCNILLDDNNNLMVKKKQLSILPTFMFYGTPGTGKSTVAELVYLSLRNNHNIDLKRLNIDELISSDFGESSKNIIEFFNNAKEEIIENDSYCMIIIDEIDSFTISRTSNDNNSIKRILLTFNTVIDDLVRTGFINKFIIIGTTNLIESIDTSILRRFYFHEDFNINLDKNEFYLFIHKLLDIIEVSPKEDFLEQLYKTYLLKNYSLGEIKDVFSRVYVHNLAFDRPGIIDIKCFEGNKSFHEIMKNQQG
ncbi:hypothetical protein CGI04_13730 [Vibrio parahaemolyticus]|uniref:ATP-binding protein n=1 Tax=Vibrio parahaemolyticus TaxID=670 RepID=UPI0011234559|nr:ATP-binding protein [Vibrio parahaemolyticus]TOL18136.1 hypothetical protein CGI04_13730 [Vibrio parahaemolyticus]